MRRAVALATLTMLLSSAACSDPTREFAGADSQLCADLTGLEAIYWDFINGVPRGDLPPTAFTIPFDFGGSYLNSTSYLLGFTVPAGWTATDAVDETGFALPGGVAGANLVRADGQATWRYMLNAQIAGNFTAASILDADVNALLRDIGNPPVQVEECLFNDQRPGIVGFESVAAKVVRTDDFTLMARAQVIIVSPYSAAYNGFVSVSPTAENEQLIYDIYVPMITQLLGGGGDTAACEDGQDNDNDGRTDFPADPDCTGPDDDTEGA